MAVYRPVRRSSRRLKGSKRTAKKTYSKNARAAKAAKTTIARAKRAKPGSTRLKALTLANSRAIQGLKAAKYGPVQVNYSHMPLVTAENSGGIHVTEDYPACLHLNSLYTGQTGEPASHWLQSKTIVIGQHQPIMQTYSVRNPAFGPMNSLMSPDSGLQPKPDGTVLCWLSTTLKFRFTAWVPEVRDPNPNPNPNRPQALTLTLTRPFAEGSEQNLLLPHRPTSTSTSSSKRSARSCPTRGESCPSTTTTNISTCRTPCRNGARSAASP